MTPAPISLILQDMRLPLVPTKGNIIGYVDISDTMHLEIDFIIHAWPSGEHASIFHCGTIKEERYPALFLHQYSGVAGHQNEGLYVMVSDNDDYNGGLMGDALELELAYHAEVEFTQSWFTVVLNGKILYDGTKTQHDRNQAVPCYASFLYYEPANITITNLSMWATSTLYPTTEPTTAPSLDPTLEPTVNPTVPPSNDPSFNPTDDPTLTPTKDPTLEPTMSTSSPTTSPSDIPTDDPSWHPTSDPTIDPTISPTSDPTDYSGFFIKVLDYQPTTIDVGQDAFNQMFWDSTYHIFKRECSTCQYDTHKVIYYKRHTMLDSFDLYTYTYNWQSTDNILGTDFDLFSTLSDAMTGSNPWTYCNYDDTNIGMFRDCGPTGEVWHEWTSKTRGGDSASFFIYTNTTSGPTSYPTGAPTRYSKKSILFVHFRAINSCSKSIFSLRMIGGVFGAQGTHDHRSHIGTNR